MKLLQLLLTGLASCALQVKAHGYVYWPHSRQYLANKSQMAGAFSDMDPLVGVDDLETQWSTQRRRVVAKGMPNAQTKYQWAKDLCGNNEWDVDNKPAASYDSWAGKPVATYKQGGNISFTIVMSAEHGGVHEFRLCPKQVSKKLGSLRDNAKCLDTYFIGRMCTPSEKCGCYSGKCKPFLKHKEAKDKIFSHGKPYGLKDGAHVMEFTLPKEAVCDQCTVQWYWHTPMGEAYKNCMDIKIEKSDEVVPDPTRRRSPKRRRSAKPTKPSRRRSQRRRGCPGSVKSSSALSIGQKWADMEYHELGCFPLVGGDHAAKNLPPTATTLRDLTCMNHKSGSVPCRSGLPFYRLQVHPEAAVRLCFSFCSSKGLDLFGLVGEVECRCGATVLNRKVFKKVMEPDSSLILAHDTKLAQCGANSVKIYRYDGWMQYPHTGGVQDAMLDLNKEDISYMDSVIAGKHVEADKAQPAPTKPPTKPATKPPTKTPTKAPTKTEKPGLAY